MRNIQQLFVALIVTLLAACGGGGTLDSGGGNGGGNGGNTTPVYSLSVVLTDSNGQSSTSLSQATPLTITATLTATNSGNVANQVVEFSLNNAALAGFGNSAATALTNAEGVATLTLLVGNQSGAGQLTATYGTATTTAGFTSAGDGGDQVDITVGSVVLIADSLQLGTGVADKVELTALVRDNNNVVLADIPVVFSSDSGEIVPVDAATGDNGAARATITTQTNKTNRTISVTARVQQQSSALTLNVVGNQLEVSAPASVVLGDNINVDVFLTDSNGSGIQGVEVEVVSALGNPLSDDSPATSGTSGKASFSYSAANSGVDTLTVSAAGVSAAAIINVSADAFTLQSLMSGGDVLAGDPVQEVSLNTPQRISAEWLVNGAPNPAAEVVFSTTRGVIAKTDAELVNNTVSVSNDTDSDGIAEAFIQSQFAGLVTLNAAGGEGEGAVSAKKVIEFVATMPSHVETQVFPAQVGPGESSTIRAVVRDDNNNPVKNEVVVFTLDNAAGGTISSGTAVTNSQGVATTVFTADATSGAGVDGLNLVVRAALQQDNTIAGTADIAVGERTLFFRFGTGNVIEKPSDSTYSKEFSIIVTDSSGNPVANQALNVSVTPVYYYKGNWERNPLSGTFLSWIPTPSAVECPNEDANLNGIMDPGEDTTGLGNNDGQLTPGNRVSAPQTVTADENGIAVFDIIYPQDVGGWMEVRLRVSGVAAGTENVSSREYTLSYAQDDADDEASPPVTNAFGVELDCTTVN